MTPNSSTDSATRDGLEEAATAAKVLVRQLNQAAWNSGNADAEDSWKRQERTAAAQDKLLNETLAAVDTLLAASRAEVERLRADAARYRLIRAGYCVLELLTPEARPEEGLNYRQSTLRAELNYGNAEEGDALDRVIDAALAAISTKKD